MSYYNIYKKNKDLDFGNTFAQISNRDVLNAVESDEGSIKQLLALLSPKAENCLEMLAQRAHQLTVQHFGKTIQLYTPIYLSNYCQNQCAYCGFNLKNDVARQKMSLLEVEAEAKFIASTGLKHILVLTGESRVHSSIEYIKSCIDVLKKYFSSIAVEIYALNQKEYEQIVWSGADGLTLYQETYDENVYDLVHKSGPKKDYCFRLDAPERGAKAGFRNINLGVLLGLSSWRRDVFFLGLHAKYLQDNFSDVDIGISIPRLRPHAGDFSVQEVVSDKNIVQVICALRIFLPRLSIAVSTRENAQFRENILPLGVTRFSAGSTTKVGGHTKLSNLEKDLPQFEIADQRNVAQVKQMLIEKGYQPVLKDWMLI